MPQAATQAPPATGSFCWFDLNTRDVEGAKKFYRELCGWTTTASAASGFGYHHWEKDGVMFGGIMDMNSPEWANVPSHWMSYISVADVDVKASKVTELGGNICVPPTDIPNVGRFSVVNDPTGGTFSLIRVDQPKPIAPVIGWNELMTRDAATADSFYAKLLGWTNEAMSMGEFDYIICSNAGQPIGGIFPMSGPKFEHVPPHWLNYISTTQVDADAKKIEKLGGKIVVPPTDIPNGFGRFCVFSDPGGAHIALHQGP